MTEDEKATLLEGNSILLQVISSQALTLRILVDMLEGCALTDRDGAAFTRQRLLERLQRAADALENMAAEPSPFIGRPDVFALRYVIGALSPPAKLNS